MLKERSALNSRICTIISIILFFNVFIPKSILVVVVFQLKKIIMNFNL